MEVSHDEAADYGGYDSGEFYVFVGVYAVGEVVADWFIEEDDEAAGDQDQKAEKKPAEIKLPIHKRYYTGVFSFGQWGLKRYV